MYLHNFSIVNYTVNKASKTFHEIFHKIFSVSVLSALWSLWSFLNAVVVYFIFSIINCFFRWFCLLFVLFILVRGWLTCRAMGIQFFFHLINLIYLIYLRICIIIIRCVARSAIIIITIWYPNNFFNLLKVVDDLVNLITDRYGQNPVKFCFVALYKCRRNFYALLFLKW